MSDQSLTSANACCVTGTATVPRMENALSVSIGGLDGGSATPACGTWP